MITIGAKIASVPVTGNWRKGAQQSPSAWILGAGVWSDTGVWKDAETWKDS